ncbi:hypothetical protein [Cohnella terricola]|uniref:Uncharacterized protein n=1 Tax=Cohnella terricola TaxID=1289167 RepID=A0A559JGT1_9BACL|nr:hypothetical protein [Cohnella terricola]TVX99077.1 hypothetical protein FPZ45_14080 [Cohnella terricola]
MIWPGMDPDVLPYGQIAFAIAVLLIAGGLLGLLWLNVFERGKWLLAISWLGCVAYEIAHVIILYYWGNNIDQTFKPLGAMLIGIGMVACEIAAIRAKVWMGWSRLAPLLLGVYFFVGPLVVRLP